MTKKTLLKFGLLGIGGALIAGSVIGTSVVLSSCSNSAPFSQKTYVAFNANKPVAKTFAVEQQQGSQQEQQNSGTAAPKPDNVVDMNPSTNENAIKDFQTKLEELQKKAVSAMQTEFDQGLLQFFQANELETDIGGQDFEAEINYITVKNVTYDKAPVPLVQQDGQQTVSPFGKVVVDVTIKYDVEKNDTKTTESQDKKIELIPQLAGKNDAAVIVQQLKGMNIQNKEIISELKEIYFGDKDGEIDLNNQFSSTTTDWEDKGGVLNFLNNFINNINPYAKMAGWNINLSQVTYTTNQKAVPDPTKSIWVPSSAISTIYYPKLDGQTSSTTNINDVNKPNSENGVDLFFDIQKLSSSKKQLNTWITDVFAKGPGSTLTGAEINPALEKLKLYGVSFGTAEITQIQIGNLETKNKESTIEIEFITNTTSYELDVQSSWFTNTTPTSSTK